MTLPKPLTSRERSQMLMEHLDAVANDPDYWSPFAKPFHEALVEEAPEPTGAEYYFGYGIGPNNAPSLEAVKTWTAGEERRFDTFTIAEFDDFADADDLEAELETLQKEAGLEAAMGLAEDMATANRYLDPLRDDPRVFFQNDAPPDPFTTSRQREQNLPDVAEMDTEPLESITDPIAGWMARADAEREANATLDGAAWFEATFDRPERELLQPLDDTVNYAVVVQAVDPWTDELAVEKYWKLPGGYLGIDGLTLETFDSDDEAAREKAEANRLGLLETHDERGLDGMMHQAELAAMQAGWLDGNRADKRLFRQGPPDRFETLAQELADERNPFWNTDGDHSQTPEPGSWDELIAREAEKPVDELPQTPFDRLWHVYDRPVETPEGAPLGHALYLTYYPELQRDDLADDDFSDADYPTHAKTLEMARFETAAQADKFAKEFEGYVRPGLLDPPELAEEVAKLEGLPAAWEDLDYQGIVDFMSGDTTVVRDAGEWHPRDPTDVPSDESPPQPEFDL
ncbi:MAG: hypothetical protein J0M33_02840 [Anaerolineae bacterium]|nr:hypothetical protein [Anaerolineae bacterium]